MYPYIFLGILKQKTQADANVGAFILVETDFIRRSWWRAKNRDRERQRQGERDIERVLGRVSEKNHLQIFM